MNPPLHRWLTNSYLKTHSPFFKNRLRMLYASPETTVTQIVVWLTWLGNRWLDVQHTVSTLKCQTFCCHTKHSLKRYEINSIVFRSPQQQVHELMTKAKTPKILGSLREQTNIVPKSRCRTRWSGTFDMVDRFVSFPFCSWLNLLDTSNWRTYSTTSQASVSSDSQENPKNNWFFSLRPSKTSNQSPLNSKNQISLWRPYA